MTIASGPARPYLEFAVQRTANEFKRACFGLAPGDTVQITAPRGHFLLDRQRPAAMIASGIGVTPFRSMLQALADENATLSGAIAKSSRPGQQKSSKSSLHLQTARKPMRAFHVHDSRGSCERERLN
jgi:ferredoxin-NADP reductase